MPDTLLIQFAREPVPGAVKTRLSPPLSADEACALHCELVQHTARTLCSSNLGTVQLAVAGAVSHPLFDDCRSLGVTDVVPQAGDDLGERMVAALAAGLARFPRVVLVGSDCPGLDTDYLTAAITALDEAEVVIGPAEDGGYVLVGLTRLNGRWFDGVDWGSDRVLLQTRERLRQTGAGWRELAVLRDIDRPEDLAWWRGEGR